MNKINSLKDLASIYSIKHDLDEKMQKLIEKYVYKYTDCGAWIEFIDGGIKLGSIVEGVDECTNVYTLMYGQFTENQFYNTLTLIDEEAQAIWDNTHGCEDCGMGGSVNPECKTCDGNGAII